MWDSPSRLGSALRTLVAAAALCGPAQAEDLPIFGRKLLIVERPGSAKLVFLAKDAGIDLGRLIEPVQVSATFEAFYSDAPSNRARFELASSGWITKRFADAEYRNRAAPEGGGVRKATIERGTRVKLVARSLGDTPEDRIDLSAGGAPGDRGLTTILTVQTDEAVRRFCTRFSSDAGSKVRFRERKRTRKLRMRKGKPVDCDGVGDLLMEPDLAEGFLSMPWPNDIRRTASGAIDMTGYPGSEAAPFLGFVLDSGAAHTFDFGTNAAIFFRASAPLEPATLPTVAQSQTPDATVLVVDLDHPERPPAPLLVDFRNKPTRFRPGQLLTLLPYPGHPLERGARMAAIVFDGVRDLAGSPLAPAPLIAALDAPWEPGKPLDEDRWAELQAQRADVFSYVESRTPWSPEQVVAFTVFTTQDARAEMAAIAASVAALPQPAPLSRIPDACSSPADESGSIRGRLELPKWQAGEYPYASSGGAIVVEDGAALQQGSETVDYEMVFPCGPAPAAGWPILLFMDGTGGSLNTEPRVLGQGPLPYVVASIAPLYGGDRKVPGSSPGDLYFNLTNPLAGRTNQLQQAADMMYLRRVVEGITLSAAETASGGPVETNDALAVIAGHSQGAVTIPLALAVDPPWQGAFISAGGAGLYQTLLQRRDTRSLLELGLGIPPFELDEFHPLPHALQTIAEIGDSANYAPYVDTAHILSIGGTLDGCSPLEVIALLGIGLGTETAHPLYVPMFGSAAEEPPAVELPATANLADGRTAVTVQLRTGHFGAVTNPELGRSFVTSLAAGVPTIDPGKRLLKDKEPGCAGRYWPLP